MMDLELTPEQEQLRQTAARIADERYAARAEEWDLNSVPFPLDERKRLAEVGFLGIALPESYGGGGATLLDALLVIEEFAKRSLTAAFQVFEGNTGAARVIDLFGSAAAKERFLPAVAEGRVTMAVSISEPDAGSAATDLTTTATRDGDEYVLSGVKRWCSGAGHAEQYLVYVKLDAALGSKGIGAIIVDRDAGGLTFGPPERLMGFHGIPSADMVFDRVRVPIENVIIEAGGFNKLFTAFSIERLGNATMSLAIAQSCLDRTARYIQERHQFGKAIMEFQLVQATLADMVMQVDAARLLLYRAAARAGTGAPRPLEASIAKLFANDMVLKVTDAAMQLHGGYGYSTEYGIERMHRDARGWALGGGTGNIQRLRIASEYLGRRFDQRA
jgi:alkylation response protein AidB-like acyl-CoA dehydrogenase